MKFDTSHMRYLGNDDFRVLTAMEMGSKNHEVVPTSLIVQISGLKSASAVNRALSNLAKIKLVTRLRNAQYDGFRLSYLGYDYLALKAFVKRESLLGVGNQIGIGKESDIYVVVGKDNIQNVLKIHRLGRVSFRSVKNNRDYLKSRQSASWMYLSRLAAQKEYAFMKVLHENGFQVPTPIDQSRHQIVMSLVDGFPMRQLREHDNPGRLYSTLMEFIVKLANHGLIHCDFNEFNIMIREEFEDPDQEIVVIDFPQAISIDHPDAAQYFARDVDCIRTFFERKLHYVSEDYPRFDRDVKRIASLDLSVEASGFSKKQLKEFEKAMEQTRATAGEGEHSLDEEEDDDESENEDESGSEQDDSEQEDEEGEEEDEPKQ
uniref:Serine/threonine-protein kinase RIO2 n=1 Tax=Blastobotrys adeninivorans TaxID=409370 RepID=A0A060T3P2_BLAAD